jgi:uncharacterized protein (DUF433 family)
MLTVQSINQIATDERVRGGRPYIIGTTLTVADVAIVKIYHAQDADIRAQLRRAEELRVMGYTSTVTEENQP